MASIRSELVNYKSAGIHLFEATYRRRLRPALHSKNVNLAGRLTKQAKQNIDDTRLRDAERGTRPRSRLTGTLQGHSGRSSAIRGEALKGKKGLQGAGVGWPRQDILNRRARHWRALEFGTDYVEMPRGLFLSGGTPRLPGARSSADHFITYREFLKKEGLRRGFGRLTARQRQARQRRVSPVGLRGSTLLVGQTRRGSGIEAKHFLENAWNDIMGPGGVKGFGEQVKVIRKVFENFRPS